MANMEKEFSTNITNLFTALWKVDTTLVMLPWNTQPSLPPYAKNASFPTTKQAAQAYVNKVFLSPGENCWLKAKIGHSKTFKSFDNETFQAWLCQNDAIFFKEIIQEKITTKAGWFLGL